MSNIQFRYYCAGIGFIFGILSTCTSFGQSGNLTIGQSFEIRSAQLSEKRIINVYFPVGYDPSGPERYPVIYLLDGGMDEDFIHVVGLVQFNSQPWIAGIPKSIVVGIENVDRKRDFTYPTTISGDKAKYPTIGGSAKFISFIEKELQPYIKTHFKTNNRKTIIGESLGGLLATEILLTKPYLFDRYIIISPSIWWDNGSLLKRHAEQVKNKTDIYIGVGKEGLTPGAEPRVMEVDANLLKEKIENAHDKNTTVYLDYLPNENHATISHQAIYNAFKVLYAVPAKK